MISKRYIIDVLRCSFMKPWWSRILVIPFLFVLFDYLAVAPIGSQIFLWFKLPIALGFLAAIIAFLVLPLLLFVQSLRKFALTWWFRSLCFLAFSLLGITLGNKIRGSAFHDLAERSTPLVSAIERYIHDRGVPPESLNQLIPDYLSEIPNTGMMAYPEYQYEVGEDAGRYEGNPWILHVFTPSGGINFDEFMYFPLQNYPVHGYGGSFQRMGKWAYLHE